MIQNTTTYSELDTLLGYLVEMYLPKEVIITVCHNDNVLRHHSTPEIELQALVTATGLTDWYMLYVREGLARPQDVICHEFAHLVQMVTGRLQVDYSTRRFTWLGRQWPSSTPYDSRPWEVEAFRLQGKYIRSYNHFIHSHK